MQAGRSRTIIHYEEYTQNLKNFLELRIGPKNVLGSSYNQVKYFSFKISTVKHILENTRKFDWKATGSSLRSPFYRVYFLLKQ